MNRPTFVARPYFIDQIHEILFGVRPGMKDPLKKVMEAVMNGWDYSAVTATATSRECAQIGLCQIGMHWHASDNLAFTLEDVAQKLAEISPELAGKEVTAHVMRDMLNLYRLATHNR